MILVIPAGYYDGLLVFFLTESLWHELVLPRIQPTSMVMSPPRIENMNFMFFIIVIPGVDQRNGWYTALS